MINHDVQELAVAVVYNEIPDVELGKYYLLAWFLGANRAMFRECVHNVRLNRTVGVKRNG